MITWPYVIETEIGSDFAADNDASFNLSCPTHYHISHHIVEYELRKYAYPNGYADFFTDLTNNESVASILSPTLTFDGWPWKTIGHLFYATLSFVHHFKAIGELKLKL